MHTIPIHAHKRISREAKKHREIDERENAIGVCFRLFIQYFLEDSISFSELNRKTELSFIFSSHSRVHMDRQMVISTVFIEIKRIPSNPHLFPNSQNTSKFKELRLDYPSGVFDIIRASNKIHRNTNPRRKKMLRTKCKVPILITILLDILMEKFSGLMLLLEATWSRALRFIAHGRSYRFWCITLALRINI